MAFFKFRKGGGDEHPAPAPAAESIEVMRKRARHRLIGAAVLVLLGVIGFPLLFDSQPRPISVDIPIEIPDKNTVKPLATTALPASKPAATMLEESDAGKEHVSTSPASAMPTVAPPVVRPNSGAAVASPAAQSSRASTGVVSGSGPTAATPAKPTTTKPASKPEVKPAERPVDKPVVKPADKPVAKPADKPADKPAARADDGAKAQALLEGRDTSKPAATPASAGGAGRFIVQIGAFADGVKAHEVRVKLEKAGLKTYTHVAETKDGKRIRVRLGPFNGKAEADKAAEKVRKLDLPAAILEL